jgi:hypothetical protein
VDQFNQWFIQFAPEAFRSTRLRTTDRVKAALLATDDLRKIDAATLHANPSSLATLRMCAAPPLAVDRLIGLAGANRSLIGRMEEGKLASRMKAELLNENLTKVCRILTMLLDRDIFPWLATANSPTEHERDRASTIVADRLCSAVANPIVRNAQEARQLNFIAGWLDARGYRKQPLGPGKQITEMEAATYSFRMNISVGKVLKVNIPVDVVVQPRKPRKSRLPILIEAKSAGDFTNTNKRRKEEATKIHQLRATFDGEVCFLLFLCGYFGSDYLGYEAAEGLDWVWEHDRRLGKGGALADMPIQLGNVESLRQSAQTAIDATKSAAERNRLGQFATPNDLAIEMAKFVDPYLGGRKGDIRFADPSIGSGSFFSAALAVYGAKRITSAVGVELDPAFAGAARDLWGGAGLDVVAGDFTRVVADATPLRPNPILANPPYVRHHHIGRDEKSRLKNLVRTMSGVEVNGLSGLYIYFFLLATAWLEEDGWAAWLIPSEFMDVNYGAALKQFLTQRLTLIRAHRFDPAEVQFDDALVSSAVVVFKKTAPPPGHRAEFSFGGTLSNPRAIDRLPLDQLRASRKWSIYPAHPKNDRCTTSAGHGQTLSDFFRIQRGIATGGNKFFILDRRDATRLDLPQECLRPILPSPRFLKNTVVDSGADGYPLLEQQLCVIDCDLPEHIMEERYPSLSAYLQTADALGLRSGYLVGKRTPWYRQEQREPCPFLCTYMGRGSNQERPFRFIYNRSQAIATNLYLLLYPQQALAGMLREYPARESEVHELLRLVTGNELRGEGRVYGGGLNKIEPRELGRISAATFVDRWPELGKHVRRTRTRMLFD